MIRDPWKPQNLLISRLLGWNSKIWSVAQNKVTIRVSMQKIRLLASLVWSSDMCGSKKLLLIFYFEDFCNGLWIVTEWVVELHCYWMNNERSLLEIDFSRVGWFKSTFIQSVFIHSYFELVLHLLSAKINPNHSNYTVRIEMYTIADKNKHDKEYRR